MSGLAAMTGHTVATVMPLTVVGRNVQKWFVSVRGTSGFARVRFASLVELLDSQSAVTLSGR